jgi:pSer/pThr/pTyr-binding forkhead associated (FHA) protein
MAHGVPLGAGAHGAPARTSFEERVAVVTDIEYRLRSGERVYVLPLGEVLIGREPACQIQLDGDLVSRRHARLVVEEEGIRFEDLGSSNGSFVNELRVDEPLQLREGDRIRIGLTLLEVETAERHRRATPTLRLVHCDACGAVMAHDMGFCVQCGHRLRRAPAPRCRRCATAIPPGDAYCPSCGTRYERGDEGRAIQAPEDAAAEDVAAGEGGEDEGR